ncbi:MAG: hypothetical protein ABI306_02830 [Caulobacteraceae bacterium]
MNPVALLVAAFAVWRLAHLLHAEDGPWSAFARLRAAFEARGSGLFACFFCVSAWPALPAALLVGGDWRQTLLLWPALSAAAILIERAAFPATFVDVPEFFEDPTNPDEET